MLLPLSWLKEHLAKPEVRIQPKELAEKLTLRGIAVASIRDGGSPLKQVVVGRIEAIEKHPNADRLQVTQITTGDGPNRQIVCGAKNIAVGDIVPVALPGAILPGNFAIKETQIRGVESHGMLCSAKELGVADDAEGILQLPKSAPLGQPVASLIGSSAEDDPILEFELTPNRGDCLSVVGLAREIAPLLKTRLREPKPAKFRISPHRTSSIVKVEVDDPAICPRYVARVLDGLKVGPSPEWLQKRLEAVGVRPLNNIVDVANYVMLEYGQPLHTFDLRKIESGTIRVGECKTPAPFTLLNGETVMLEPGDILIYDGDRPIALAGIMGGQNSQIENDTTSIVLESAAFPAAQIRRTAKRLGIFSDAAKRFEKGYDLAAVLVASERAAVLLRDSFNANVYHPPIDTNEAPILERSMAVDLRDVRRLTGLHDLSTEHVVQMLDAIEISSSRKSQNVLTVKVPSFRRDLQEPIDIVEEVARLYGFDAIPATEPLSHAIYDHTDEGPYELERDAKRCLAELGFRETIHYSFVGEDLLRRYGFYDERAVSLQNPLSDEMKVMRTSLVPSLLETYKYNRNRKVENQRLFEVARVYAAEEREETGVREILTAAGLLAGNLFADGWNAVAKAPDFYHGKGIVERLARQLSGARIVFERPQETRLLHPARSATLRLGQREIGFVGELHPFVARKLLETTEPVVVFELALDGLRRSGRGTRKYHTPSKFPSIDVDLAILVDREVPFATLRDTVRNAGGPLLRKTDVFDVYEGERIPEGKKSLGLRLRFQSNDRTLQDAEVATLKETVVRALKEKHSAELRA
jgi:phenylalanyl-tRNA synthetase beta chain